MIQLLQVFGLLVMGAVTPPGSGQSVEDTSAVATAAPVKARGAAGFKVAVDPVTGRIIAEPTAADLEALAAGRRLERRRSMWELRRFDLSRGGEGVFLDGWADHAYLVQRDAEGRLRLVCATGEGHAAAAEDAEGNLE